MKKKYLKLIGKIIGAIVIYELYTYTFIPMILETFVNHNSQARPEETIIKTFTGFIGLAGIGSFALIIFLGYTVGKAIANKLDI